MTEFKPYMRAPVVADRKLEVHFEETSNNTLTMVKLEHPIIISEIEKAGRWARRYITIHGKELGEMSDPYAALTLELRNSHPALNGMGEHRYILSDEGFHDLIDHAWLGKKTAAEIFTTRKINVSRQWTATTFHKKLQRPIEKNRRLTRVRQNRLNRSLPERTPPNIAVCKMCPPLTPS